MSPLGSFWLGFLGALLIELLPLYGLRKVNRADWPDWLSEKTYWGISSVGFLVGGGFAAGYASNTDLTWYMALNIGAAWPVIVSGLANVTSFKASSEESS